MNIDGEGDVWMVNRTDRQIIVISQSMKITVGKKAIKVNMTEDWKQTTNRYSI